MKKLLFFIAAAVCISSCCKAPKIDATVPAKIENGMIVLETPAREAGQQSALGLTVDPIPVVRIGFVGLGMRGPSHVNEMANIDGTQIVALCDLYQENVDKVQKDLKEWGLPEAAEYVGVDAYKQLCERDDIDLVYVSTDWLNHIPVSLYALEHGKNVACEVPSMTNIKEAWDVVNTVEKTRKHFMMMENCCYDFFEEASLNMAQHGLFGEIYHVEGAYIHNLSPFWTRYADNWRLDYNSKNRGDVYPTHGLGPVCQVLNIHRGDKMNYLISMDTDAFRGKETGKELMNAEEYANGDHTVSLIRTEKGHQIEIQHNVVAARPYSRLYELTGTKGYATKYPKARFALQPDPERFVTDEQFDSLMTAYKFPFIAEIEEKAKTVGGHGGMDYIMDYRLIYCLQNGLPLDQDVYDAAEWCCVNELSKISLENNSMPVAVPDFTRGDWNKIDGYSYAFKK